MPNKVISDEAIQALRKDFVAGATLNELMERYSITRHKARTLTAGYTRLSDGTPLMPVSSSRAPAHARNRPMPVVAKLSLTPEGLQLPGCFQGAQKTSTAVEMWRSQMRTAATKSC